MKKIILCAVMMLGTSAMAAGYGAAGCGLGSVVFEGSHGKGAQILAATTNGTSGNQTFGITTGTLNCDTGRLKISKTTFIEANKFALANDIARGQGESLAALSSLYGCSNSANVASEMKANYASIFSGDTSTQALDSKIGSYMKSCI